MIFKETKLRGAFTIDVEPREDNRGFFARVFCQREFQEHGLKPVIAQAHIAVELTADNRRALYVPERFAHGYQVLEDGTETSYQVGEFYTPAAEGGLPFDDRRLGLTWPLPVGEVSAKDRAWKTLEEIEPELKRRMRV